MSFSLFSTVHMAYYWVTVLTALVSVQSNVTAPTSQKRHLDNRETDFMSFSEGR